MKRIILFLIFLTPLVTFGQGMTFGQFANKIQKYFDNKLIEDLENVLPSEGGYQIWGWDVGDFTGDGYYDVAFSVRYKSDKGKIIRAYMFADIEGYLKEIASFKYEFYEIPLEIGVVIRDNVCYITQKHKQFNWTIWGYTFQNGNLIKVDEFNTERDGKFTKESYRNYVTLRNNEKYLKTTSGDIDYKIDFVTLPSYPRGKIIYDGYSNTIFNNEVKYVSKGAFDWEGAKDASFKMSSSYDSEFIYFSIDIIDDKVISPDCKECVGDYVDIWIDRKPLETDKVYYFLNRKIDLTENNLDSYYNIAIYPGDFYEKMPFVQLRTSDKENQIVKEASQTIKASSTLTENGYNIRVKIPISLIGLKSIDINRFYEVPCIFIVHDIDNSLRPEEESQIASTNLNIDDAPSYGTLLIVPSNQWYGTVKNIYSDKILNYLKKYGL
ncbi:MAG: hypothetical protein R2863_01655 [Candidatus Kapaibacterium sp.]|nr:hypothetical protein [Ignavibacteriota bacterium]MCB9220674.1 hypothetical protein [Ignavibacteria bacterium]